MIKVLKVDARCIGWISRCISCTFIGWFEFATGFLSVIGYLALIVLSGEQTLKDELKNLSDPAKYYVIAASSVSAIVIEFYMMLGWYLLLGIYKEDPDRLKIWIRAVTHLFCFMFCVLIVWIVGLCVYPSAYLSMTLPTCNYIVALAFGVHSISVVKLCYAKLKDKQSTNELSPANGNEDVT